MGLCVRSPFGCRLTWGGVEGLPLGPPAASMKGLSSEIASLGVSGVHPLFAFPVLKWCRGRDRCGFTGRPRRGLGAELTLSSGGAPVALANRRRLERGLAATFARQVRFGAWFRTLVRAYGSRGGGGIWSAATCFRAGSAVQFSSFGERWLTALRGPSYFVAGGSLGGPPRYQHKGTTRLV